MAETLSELMKFAQAWAPATLIAGMLMLLLGGHWLVEGSVQLARKLGIAPVLIGLTIVAFGTSAPELFFNLAAATGEGPALSFGNVIGSNIANLGLVIGIACFFVPIVIDRDIVRRDLPLLVGSTILLVILGWLPATRLAADEDAGIGVGMGMGFQRLDGLAFLAMFAVVLGLWYRAASRGGGTALGIEELEAVRAEVAVAGPPDPTRSYAAAITLIVIGLLGLVVGGKAAEIGAIGVARSLGIAEEVISLTIVAFATSLPEVVTMIIACRRGEADLAVGNVVGSNLFNVLFVLGTTSLVADVPIPRDGGSWDVAVMAGLTIGFVIFATTNGRRLLRWQSALMLVSYVAFIAWTAWTTIQSARGE